MSTPTSAPRLLVRADRPPAPRLGALFLVGGYDGSGNYGDMLQLQAALALVARAAPHATPIPVIELDYRDSHAKLAARSPALDSLPVAFFDSGLAPLPDGMRQLALGGSGCAPANSRAHVPVSGGVYLYGGGYLNAWWGTRKLAMARAAEATVLAAQLPRWRPVVSGVQADPKWTEALGGGEGELLRRAAVVGVRDEGSLPAAGEAGVLTGDDAVAVLAPFAGSAAPGPDLRINLHLQDHPWVTGEGDGLFAFLTDLVAALGDVSIQPVIAYEDRRITERPLAERLTSVPALRGRIAGEPLVLRPGGLSDALAVLGRARLTVSCSYHVALTSDMIGVPAALVAGTPYYEQKAAGLIADFALPDAFVLRPSTPAEEAAAALRGALERPDELAEALVSGGARAVTRRREAESTLAAALDEVSASAAPDPVAARADRAAEAEVVEHLRAELAERDARLLEREAAFDRLWLELVGYKETQERLNARLYELETALDSERGEVARLHQSHRAVVDSRTWRLTEPLRRAANARRNGSR